MEGFCPILTGSGQHPRAEKKIYKNEMFRRLSLLSGYEVMRRWTIFLFILLGWSAFREQKKIIQSPKLCKAPDTYHSSHDAILILILAFNFHGKNAQPSWVRSHWNRVHLLHLMLKHRCRYFTWYIFHHFISFKYSQCPHRKEYIALISEGYFCV